jgi:hypothetical protein
MEGETAKQLSPAFDQSRITLGHRRQLSVDQTEKIVSHIKSKHAHAFSRIKARRLTYGEVDQRT